ncbi:MAG: hypothetical protein IMZ52_01295 [Actinobacteria bacterium]|nr:hypothetical protein [Actinomycetota bacterium]MBE3121491.1 hypothetical protein [Thermoplasmata archaeon]
MEKLTSKEGEEIMQSVKWLIENKREGVEDYAIVAMCNELLIHSYSHVKLRYNDDKTIDFV